ncbi:MAG: hypothetical protein R6X32_07675, partial [Chloroflexota bacterium]
MARKLMSLLLSLVAPVAGMALLFTLSDIPTTQAIPLLDPPTYVSGTVTQTTTWTAVNSPYVVIGYVYVPPGITLTIESGVVVKFDTDMSLNIDGELIAQGTTGDKIYFTSLKDDSVGGDTNGDGDNTSPMPGDWDYIRVNGGQINLKHAVVRYGGPNSGSLSGNILSLGANARLALDTVQVNNSYGYGIKTVLGGGVLTITNSLIQDNGGGLSIGGGVVTITNSLVENTTWSGID